MPDGQNLFPPNPPDPPQTLWPKATRPEIIVDQYRVLLADPDGNLIGMPSPIPIRRTLATTRNGIREF